MKIGILSPISIQEFIPYLDEESRERARGIFGLRGPSVDVIVHEYLRAGHEVVIFTLDLTVNAIIKLTGERLTIYIGEYRKNSRLRGLTFFFKEISQLRECVESEKCDIVHAHWTYEFALGALTATCPIVVTVRDMAGKVLVLFRDGYRLIRWVMNWWVFLQKKKIRFIANSNYLQEQIQLKYRVDVPVIPNAVSNGFLLTEQRHKKHNIIVSISNGWGKLKNIDVLIFAFKQIRQKLPDAELWLVGGEFRKDHPNVEKLLSGDAMIFDGVRLLGNIEHDELPKLLQQIDVMVHPSLEESFGNILIEAMAQGIPVIGGKSSGAVPWVLGDGHAGVLCDVKSSCDIADKATEILTNAEEWKKYSEAGRNYVNQNFTAASVMKQTFAVYHECIKLRAQE